MNIVMDSVFLDGLVKTLQEVHARLPCEVVVARSDLDRALGYLRGVLETAHRSPGSTPSNPLERPLEELCARLHQSAINSLRKQSIDNSVMVEHWAKEGKRALLDLVSSRPPEIDAPGPVVQPKNIDVV